MTLNNVSILAESHEHQSFTAAASAMMPLQDALVVGHLGDSRIILGKALLMSKRYTASNIRM